MLVIFHHKIGAAQCGQWVTVTSWSISVQSELVHFFFINKIFKNILNSARST